MKKLIYLLIVLAAGYWIYTKCSNNHDNGGTVIKQVRVAVKTANLRTGPGTNYAIATDSAGAQCQMRQGTLLDVVGEQKGWYEVSVPGTEGTAYIKQSLCVDPNAKQAGGKQQKKKSKDNGENQPAAEEADTPTEAQPDTPTETSTTTTSSSDDDFEEEVEEAPFIPYTR